ncbi:MAG: gas vesicle protein K [Candidatus Methylomirabilales bacterium]
MVLKIDEKSLKRGLLGLVIALVEIIKDTLKLQAVRRMEGNTLTEEETERLGTALIELDTVIEQIKEEQGLNESVRSVREGLDNIVDDLVDQIINPEAWKLQGEEEWKDADWR